jgi:arylsulfatase A-like enzyme
LDVYPTILDIAGVGSTKTKEAESLLPRIQDPKIRSAEQLIFAERQPYDEVAVWKGNWKFILRNPDMPAYEPSDIRALKQHIGADDFFINIRKYDIAFTDELYDLSVDAYEQQNMAGTGLPINVCARGKRRSSHTTLVSLSEVWVLQ